MKQRLLALAFLFSFFSVGQTTLWVTNLNDSGPGSLRQQVINSSQGDTIQFTPSLLSSGSDTLKLFFPITFNHGVTIRGVINGKDTLYIDGQDSTQIFYMDFSSNQGIEEMTIEDLAIIRAKNYTTDDYVHTSNGGALMAYGLKRINFENVIFRNCHIGGNGLGGAIALNECDTVVINNCQFEGNHTDSVSISGLRGWGGAIFNRYGEYLVINQSSFTGNYCADRGGAVCSISTPLNVRNTIFSHNSTGLIQPRGYLTGGALFITGGGSISMFSNCILTNNYAHEEGGAIYWSSTLPQRTMLFNRCTFNNNHAQLNDGGAIKFTYDTPGLVQIENSTFTNNTANSNSCMTALSAQLSLNSVTIYSNDPTQNGAMIYSMNSATREISNSIVYAPPGVTTINNLTTWTSFGNNILSDAPSFAISSDQINIDSTTLALEPLAMNGGATPTMLPKLNSVALNMGDSTDFSDAQNGPIFGRRDVGAAERAVIAFDTTLICGPITWWGNTYNNSGTYSDTAYNSNSIDSVGILVLELQDTSLENVLGTLYALENSTNTAYQWVNCDSNYAPIFGATNPSFLPPSNGSYAVILTNGNCSDTSSCYLYEEFNVLENESSNTWLTFYPNPTSGIINYNFTGAQPSSLDILDLGGRHLYHIDLSEQSQVHLPELATGMYLLRWNGTNQRIQVDRVMVE